MIEGEFAPLDLRALIVDDALDRESAEGARRASSAPTRRTATSGLGAGMPARSGRRT
jgi:hypothetical protein